MSKSTELTEALSNLIMQHPFFAVYLFDQMTIIESDEIESAATDGDTIWVGTDWFPKLSVPERVFVLAHEVLHGIYEHCPRIKLYQDRGFGPDLKPFDFKRMNYAQDYIINSTLKSSGVGVMPKQGLISRKYDASWLADDVYKDLPDNPENGNGGQGEGQGKPFDTHKPAQSKTTEAERKRAVTQAANAAKAQGKLPEDLERLVTEIMEPEVVWQDELQAEFTARKGTSNKTWAKPKKRKLVLNPGLYLPGRCGYEIGPIAAIMDQSCSISDKESMRYLSEVVAILEECEPKELHILWTDTRVAKHDMFESGEFDDVADLKPCGGGGTNLEAAYGFMAEEGIVPELCIIFTDGYTDMINEPDFPVIWCMTTDQVGKYGKTIKVDIQGGSDD